jgi:hypothetical protein
MLKDIVRNESSGTESGDEPHYRKMSIGSS